MSGNPAKRLTHGAMAAALFTVILALSVYIPMLYIISVWFLPLPIAWYNAKYETRYGIALLIASLVLAILVGGGFASAPAAFIFVVVGTVLGVCIRLKKSKIYMFLASCIATLFTFTIIYYSFVKLMAIDILKLAMDVPKQSVKTMKDMMNDFNLSAQQSELMLERLDYIERTTEYILPSGIVICIAAFTMIVLVATLPLLNRFKIDVPKFKPFREMRLPRSILWYYLIVLIVTLFVKLEEGTYVYVAVLNLSLLLSLLLSLQGFSLIHYFLHEKKMPKGVIVIVTIIALPFVQFLTLVGLIDLGFNARGIIRGEPKK